MIWAPKERPLVHRQPRLPLWKRIFRTRPEKVKRFQPLDTFGAKMLLASNAFTYGRR